ncbi:hypothetical protein DPEC_G00311160 [Dallia pectoralis]|uniref:Uncharacterized protein n=1 Tax=Dallia pectoralis TaxID=75939 RepID=A0ACC2FB52_DALPE|nr:hypothetical protein DPEC_G00311160 [Dallia pectoralis]
MVGPKKFLMTQDNDISAIKQQFGSFIHPTLDLTVDPPLGFRGDQRPIIHTHLVPSAPSEVVKQEVWFGRCGWPSRQVSRGPLVDVNELSGRYRRGTCINVQNRGMFHQFRQPTAGLTYQYGCGEGHAVGPPQMLVQSVLIGIRHHPWFFAPYYSRAGGEVFSNLLSMGKDIR